MKTITYYIALLVFIGISTGFLIQSHPTGMGMAQMFSISLLLGFYVVAMSFVGEGKVADEREMLHRYISNRSALIAGSVALSVGVLYQLFTHTVDYWLLAGLIVINVVKILSLIYSHYTK